MKTLVKLFIEIVLISITGLLAQDNEKKVDLTEMYKNPLSNGI